MLVIDNIIVNKIEKNVMSYEIENEKSINISAKIEPIANNLNSYFVNEGERHLVSFSIASVDYLKMSLKYAIYLKNMENEGCCFIIRLDINPPPHRNPFLYDYEKLEEYLEKQTDKFYKNLLNLLKKYDGHRFRQKETHCHLLILEENSCSKWAFPLEEIINLFELDNELFKNLNKLEKNKNNISNCIADFAKIINLINLQIEQLHYLEDQKNA